VLPDEETLYRAVQRRDARFDGRFFTAVKTTGVYCRPVCPARTPLRRNVRFFSHPASAEAAGFRPCRRCRPDSAPGTPPWVGPAAVVGRALRLLEDGAAEDGLHAFSERLGLGERHLRRLFVRHLGASPAQVVRTRRLHFARQLVEQTPMPLAQVALAAGFGSVRQFNAAFREMFGRTPTEARRTRPPAAGDRDAPLTLRLPFRAPLAWRHLLAFLAPRTTPGVEEVAEDTYRRTFAIDGCAGVLEVRQPTPSEPALLLTVRGGAPRILAELVRRVRRQLDLDADPFSIDQRLGESPLLRPLVKARPGLRVLRAFDPFETAVRIVLGQQVSVRAATTLCARLVERFGAPFAGGAGALTRLFPDPSDLASAPLEEIGLPATRAETIRALARDVATTDGHTPLPGIGPWTAQLLAMRVGGEPDAFPASDLVLRQAAARVASAPRTSAQPTSPKALEGMAEAWRPFRAYAAMHLWTHATEHHQGEGTYDVDHSLAV
jgi:AraC family transcriptional regulator of adaptative response / DNA-3-methyladenine glycosylase II